MNSNTSKHVPVLLDEIISYSALSGDEVFLDGTINGGGHAVEIAKRLKKGSYFVGCDVDQMGLSQSQEKLSLMNIDFKLFHRTFEFMPEEFESFGIKQPDRILLDLGWSTNQFTTAMRGFSFQEDGPLVMTLSGRHEDVLTAYEIVNSWREEEIADVLWRYGEEHRSRKIAKAIVWARKKESIVSTLQLASVVEKAAPRNGSKIHSATKTFQALRIKVNDELGTLERFLNKVPYFLKSGGKVMIISFHSLEDRMVKKAFREWQKEGIGEIVTKKPVIATPEERRINPKSRSAKLRVFEKKS